VIQKKEVSLTQPIIWDACWEVSYQLWSLIIKQKSLKDYITNDYLIEIIDRYIANLSVDEIPKDIMLCSFFRGSESLTSFPTSVYYRIGGLDSFNPCAFLFYSWLLSLLVSLGSRWKILLGWWYLYLFSGLFYFLLCLPFWTVFQLIQMIFIYYRRDYHGELGTLNIKDFFFFKQGLSTSIPRKNGKKFLKNAWPYRSKYLIGIAGRYDIPCGYSKSLWARLHSWISTCLYKQTCCRTSPNSWIFSYVLIYNIIYIIPLLVIVLVLRLLLGLWNYRSGGSTT